MAKNKQYIPVFILKKYTPNRHTPAMIALKTIIQNPTPHFSSKLKGKIIINKKINTKLISTENRIKAKKAYKLIEVK